MNVNMVKYIEKKINGRVATIQNVMQFEAFLEQQQDVGRELKGEKRGKYVRRGLRRRWKEKERMKSGKREKVK